MSNRETHLKLSGLDISGLGVIGIYEVDSLTILRIVVELAGSSNELVFKGKIKGQKDFQPITTVTGNGNTTVPIHSYDLLSIECTTFQAENSIVRLSVSGFSFVVGAEINDGSVDLDSTWSSSKITDTLVGLGDRDVRVTRFATISSGTNGRITIPYEQTVILDDFGGTVDAIVTTVANGRPTYNSAQNVQGEVVATTFDARGYYTFTSTPSSYPVAIVYRVRQKVSTYVDSDVNVVGTMQYQEVESVNTKTGAVVLSKADLGLSDVDNTSDANKPISTATQTVLNQKLNIPATLNLTLTAQNMLDKFIVLPATPVYPELVMLLPHGGIFQVNGQDFEIIGNQLRWSGKGLDGTLQENDTLSIIY